MNTAVPVSSASNQQPAAPAAQPAGVSWAEFVFFGVVLIGGFLFLRDAPYWGRAAYVGSAQFGDAEFWWNGALHFSQGIVADNPNLTFRMGYAAFGGLVAAVCGPDYRVFHQILLAVFLVTTCGLYVSLRSGIGRLAAATAILFFVFNPFTAEWLAISTSDGLGLLLNLVALLALMAGVRDGLRLRWIVSFGIFLACASLTRPLMTPFIAPAALAVIVAGWGAWRRAAIALGLLLAAFILPTIAWMAFMAATTGNFALTGASQDSSAFYAASDPQIQVWRPDMYEPVRAAAMKHFQTGQPTPRQLNAEFWTRTRANYEQHWRYHLDRLWQTVFELARFTPKRSAMTSLASEHWRSGLKWTLTLLLGALALRQRRWLAGGTVLILGLTWTLSATSQPWLVLLAGIAGLAALGFGRRDFFLWSAYWWVGVLALYLTGGTWGPPGGGTQDLNALGYRLGFQFFGLADLLVVGLLGWIGLDRGASAGAPAHPAVQPAVLAGRLTRLGLLAFLGALALLLGTGTLIVVQRLFARTHQTPVAYPALGRLSELDVTRGATPLPDITPLRVAVNAQTGEPLLTRAMSSGFIWNLPGQQRSMLLIYQQDNLRPVNMSPREIMVEISRQLPDREWMNRQGAWVIRSFPNTAQVSNLPYYFEMPAVQAFIPLASDGQSYDTSRAVIFPLAKSATQLVADHELTVSGAAPEWSLNSGPRQFPRRFALHATGPDQTIRLSIDLAKARGRRAVRYGVQLESGAGNDRRSARVHLHLGGIGAPTPTMWENDLDPAAPAPLWVEQTAPAPAGALALTAYHLQPGDTLWFYELVLTADDFTQ